MGKLTPQAVRVIKQLPTKTWLEFRLGEGKNREIRRLCEHVGLTVDKLRRVAIGGLTIEGIKPGGYRMLTKNQLIKAAIKHKEYISPKKSISLKKKGVQPGTQANDEVFKIFRKGQYFKTLESLKEKRRLEKLAEKEAAKRPIKKATFKKEEVSEQAQPVAKPVMKPRPRPTPNRDSIGRNFDF